LVVALGLSDCHPGAQQHGLLIYLVNMAAKNPDPTAPWVHDW